MRRLFTLVGILALSLFTANAHAEGQFAFGASAFDAGNHLTINGATYTNTDSGWITSDGVHGVGNQNYFSGSIGGGDPQHNNYFSFDLTSLTGAVTSASFTVDTYYTTDPGTYNIYATSLTPAEVDSRNGFTSTAYFNGLTSGPEIGSINLNPSESYTLVTLSLNSAGDAWLSENAGGKVVLGGAYDYNPAPPVPEPTSLLLLGTGIVGLAGLVRRKTVRMR